MADIEEILALHIARIGVPISDKHNSLTTDPLILLHMLYWKTGNPNCVLLNFVYLRYTSMDTL